MATTEKKYMLFCLILEALYANNTVINKGTRYEATLRTSESNVYLEYKGMKKKLLDEEEEFLDYSNREAFEVDDFNFDGIDDFAIKSGIGYGGVNTFYNLYIAQDNKYIEQKNINLCNYELYPEKKTVLIEYKSGPRHFTELYLSNENNALKHYITYENYEEGMCYIKRLYGKFTNKSLIFSCDSILEKHEEEKVFAKVKVKKARLYDNGHMETSNGMYLIKDDSIELLEGEYGSKRFLVRFKGKRTIIKYINIDDIKIESENDVENFIKNEFPQYHILKMKKGDVGADYVFVLQSNKKGKPFSELEDAYARKVVLVEAKNHNFKVMAQNDFLVGCSTCGGATGDPFRGVTIKGSYISFEELYGACVKDFQVTTFKYDKKTKKWYLHKQGIESTYCNEEVNGEPKVETVLKSKKDFGLIEFSNYKDGIR